MNLWSIIWLSFYSFGTYCIVSKDYTPRTTVDSQHTAISFEQTNKTKQKKFPPNRTAYSSWGVLSWGLPLQALIYPVPALFFDPTAQPSSA